jgi:hypothetical protein
MRISPWWLLVGAIVIGAALTGIVDALGAGGLSALDWLGTTATIAAVVIAVGIYRLQEKSSNEAHTELMDQLEAQNELLNEFAKRAVAKDEEREEPDTLTEAQRAEIEDRFGKDSISGAIDPGRGRRGRGRGALLVRLRDGRLVSVYTGGRGGRTYVREIGEGAPRSERLRGPRGGDR